MTEEELNIELIQKCHKSFSNREAIGSNLYFIRIFNEAHEHREWLIQEVIKLQKWKEEALKIESSLADIINDLRKKNK